MTGLQAHLKKWQDCRECPLAEVRFKTVLVRGQVPCDVLFVGEAPGKNENLLGYPFVGPAGKLLDSWIDQAVPRKADGGYALRIGFTNIIACIPLEEAGGGKVDEPPAKSVKACKGRLQEMIDLARPLAVVSVGSVSAKWVKNPKHLDLHGAHWEEILHPAYVLRRPSVEHPLLVRRCTVRLEEVFDKVLESRNAPRTGVARVPR